MANEFDNNYSGDVPAEERIGEEPARNLGEILALVSDEIRTRIDELKAVFSDMSLEDRDEAIALLMAELYTTERIGILAGIESDLLKELEDITDIQADS